MSDKVENLLLEHLKALRSEMSTVRSDILDMKADLRSIKSHMAGFMQAEISQDGSIASIVERIDRIERRLELAEE